MTPRAAIRGFFTSFKKNGFELIDPTEPGAQMFQHYGSFDNSINGKSLEAIERVLAGMEKQADITAGTNPQMLGQIAERDAVGNVKQGIQQSLIITEDLLELMRDNFHRMLSNVLNISQVCYKNGKKGSYIAGSESYVFEILPEHFCYSDFAISISYGSKDEIKLRELKGMVKELISNELIPPDIIVHVILSDSITEVKRLVSEAVRTSKEENNQLGKANSQLEQMSQQLKELESELNNTRQQLKAAEAQRQQTNAEDAAAKREVDKRRIDIEEEKRADLKEFQQGQLKLKEQTVQLEREQLYLDTGSAREVKNL